MAIPNKTVLVLGATGFIGGHIAKSALQAGWVVRGVRRSPGAKGHLGETHIEWVDCDLKDVGKLVEAMADCDVVFHAAGYYPKRNDNRSVREHINQGTRQITGVLQAARETKLSRLIYTSTLTTIGHPPNGETRLANEADTYTPGTLPKSAYYETKIRMEQAVMAACEEGLDCVTLNPTAVFGPGDVHLTLSRLLLGVARGWGIAWLPVTINIIDVREVAQAHIQSAEKGSSGERYIIGGHNLQLREALTIAAQAGKAPPPRIKIPLWVIDVLVRMDDGLPFTNLTGNHLRAIRHWQGYDTSKAQNAFGFNPRPVDETMRDAIAWLREQNYLE